VPAFFHLSQGCGGDIVAGRGGGYSCLSIAEEAFWWRVVEGVAKSAFYATIATAAGILSAGDAAPPTPRSAAIPAAYRTSFASPWTAVLLSNTPLVLGAPAAAATAVWALQREAARLLPVPGGAELHADAAAAVLVALAAVAAFLAALESAVRHSSNDAIVRQMLPAGFSSGGFRAHAFDSDVMWEDEPHVTVIFVDVCSFTTHMMDAQQRPEAALAVIARLFRHLDKLHAAHGANKVETAGDEYMSVLGSCNAPGAARGDEAPSPAQQARSAAGLALDIVEAAAQHHWPGGAPVAVRVGMHCGPALAGVLGGKMPRWGLFGPTPILASRMESHGEPSRVHVSGAFAAALRGSGGGGGITLEERTPVVRVKGVGEMQTFWLSRERGGAPPPPPPPPPPPRQQARRSASPRKRRA
jgi:class 3 adenylate cyclase